MSPPPQFHNNSTTLDMESIQHKRNSQIGTQPKSRRAPSTVEPTREYSERRFLPTEATRDDRLPPIALRGVGGGEETLSLTVSCSTNDLKVEIQTDDPTIQSTDPSLTEEDHRKSSNPTFSDSFESIEGTMPLKGPLLLHPESEHISSLSSCPKASATKKKACTKKKVSSSKRPPRKKTSISSEKRKIFQKFDSSVSSISLSLFDFDESTSSFFSQFSSQRPTTPCPPSNCSNPDEIDAPVVGSNGRPVSPDDLKRRKDDAKDPTTSPCMLQSQMNEQDEDECDSLQMTETTALNDEKQYLQEVASEYSDSKRSGLAESFSMTGGEESNFEDSVSDLLMLSESRSTLMDDFSSNDSFRLPVSCTAARSANVRLLDDSFTVPPGETLESRPTLSRTDSEYRWKATPPSPQLNSDFARKKPLRNPSSSKGVGTSTSATDTSEQDQQTASLVRGISSPDSRLNVPKRSKSQKQGMLRTPATIGGTTCQKVESATGVRATIDECSMTREQKVCDTCIRDDNEKTPTEKQVTRVEVSQQKEILSENRAASSSALSCGKNVSESVRSVSPSISNLETSAKNSDDKTKHRPRHDSNENILSPTGSQVETTNCRTVPGAPSNGGNSTFSADRDVNQSVVISEDECFAVSPAKTTKNCKVQITCENDSSNTSNVELLKARFIGGMIESTTDVAINPSANVKALVSPVVLSRTWLRSSETPRIMDKLNLLRRSTSECRSADEQPAFIKHETETCARKCVEWPSLSL